MTRAPDPIGGPERFVRQAMVLAEEAAARGDRPFGAVIVDAAGTILVRERNRVATTGDPLAHAEINAIRALATLHGNGDSGGLSLYVNAAPCTMCFSAIVTAGIGALGFGAPRGSTTYPDVPIDELVARSGSAPVTVRGGILGDEAAAQLQRLLR
jgi:tRNA(adenine34) deaminase